MKVIKTIIAKGPDGEVIDFAKALDMKLYDGGSAMQAAHAVIQALSDAEGERFIKTVAIHIEL